jgi:hypothetical protein
MNYSTEYQNVNRFFQKNQKIFLRLKTACFFAGKSGCAVGVDNRVNPNYTRKKNQMGNHGGKYHATQMER